MSRKKMYLPTFSALIIWLSIAGAGKHVSGQTTGLEPAGKDYPKTGSVDRFDPSMDRIIPPGEVPEIVAEGFEWSEGPLWLPEQDMLLFSDIPVNSVFSWSEQQGLQLYLKPSGYTGSAPRGGETGSNGLLLDPQGRLVLCQHGDRRMARMEAPLNRPAPDFVTLVDNWEGKRFNSPNDAVYSSGGDLYITDPAYGLEQRYKDPAREMDYTGVFRYGKDGTIALLTRELSAPNGIGLSPDESRLYVANSGGGNLSYWMVYDLTEEGTISGGRIFRDASEAGKTDRGAPDGLVVRKDGIIFATGPGGVWVMNDRGTHLGTIRTGQATSNCTLDEKGEYLYMTADMYLMRIKVKSP
jgi:gluconolactonase